MASKKEIDQLQTENASINTINKPKISTPKKELIPIRKSNDIQIKVSNKEVLFKEEKHLNKINRIPNEPEIIEDQKISLEKNFHRFSLLNKILQKIYHEIRSIKNEVIGEKVGNKFSIKTFNYLLVITILISLLTIFILNQTTFKTGVSARAIAQVEYYEAKVDKKPKDPSLRVQLGQSYLLNKQEDLAIAQFNRALEIKKNYYPAVLNLAVAYQSLDNNKMVIKYGKQAILISQNEIDSYLVLAKTYKKMKLYNESMYYLHKANSISPGNSEILIELGDVAEILGDKEIAIKYYQQAFSYNPGSNKIQKALSRLTKVNSE